MVRHLVHIFLQRHSSPVFGRPSAVTQSRTAPTCVHLGRTWNTHSALTCATTAPFRRNPRLEFVEREGNPSTCFAQQGVCFTICRSVGCNYASATRCLIVLEERAVSSSHEHRRVIIDRSKKWK
jgi:hypothetical protein